MAADENEEKQDAVNAAGSGSAGSPGGADEWLGGAAEASLESRSEKQGSADRCPEGGRLHGLMPAGLALLAFGLVLVYYLPCLTGKAQFYFSDISYFYQPFCQFISKEIADGRLPLWNPYLYCGMSQLEMPNPSLLYLPSWLLFLLPFSPGLCLYMMLHQLLIAGGTYLYLRQLKASKLSSVFGAIAVGLCAYQFSLVRNFTLPASLSCLPPALYFQHRLLSGPGRMRSYFCNFCGLAFATAGIVYVSRPEVGLPALLILAFAGAAFLVYAYKAANQEQSSVAAKSYLTYLLLNSASPLLLGLLLALPALLAGMEWAALSPRGHGLEQKAVFTWSANWYDFLGMIIAQPLGDLSALSAQAMKLRALVLSRGGYVPFLESSYISGVLFTCSIWGMSAPMPKARKYFLLALLLGFALLAAGSFTPIAPLLVSLSPALAAFRYPVKLLVFPCLILILFAVEGLDLLLAGKLSKKLLAFTCSCWALVFAFGMALLLFPQIGETAMNWRFLFHVPVKLETIHIAQMLMGKSLLLDAGVSLFVCALAFAALAGRLSRVYASGAIVLALSGLLIHNAFINRQLALPDFYEAKSELATRLKALGCDPESGDAFRILSLYKDPLYVPPTYAEQSGIDGTERNFRYARELVFYNTPICFDLYSSSGYEAAETSYYKTCLSRAAAASSQKRLAGACDAPIARFCRLTASRLVSTQMYRISAGKRTECSFLDPARFELLEENEKVNYRIFKVKNASPRIYFAGTLCFYDSFDRLQRTVLDEKGSSNARVFDKSPDLCFLLTADAAKHKDEIRGILAARGAKLAATRDEPTGLKDLRDAVPKDAGASGAEGAGGGNDSIEIVDEHGSSLSLLVESSKPRLLVLADHYYPGWHARIAGRELDILRVNIFQRGLLLPAGSHRVELYYSPVWIVPSFLISGLALVLFLLYSLELGRRAGGYARAGGEAGVSSGREHSGRYGGSGQDSWSSWDG